MSGKPTIATGDLEITEEETARPNEKPLAANVIRANTIARADEPKRRQSAAAEPLEITQPSIPAASLHFREPLARQIEHQHDADPN